jgi:hypothetical protein
MALKIYFAGIEVTQAVNIELDLITEAISVMTFELPPTFKEEWVTYQFHNILGYEGATLKFSGFIEKVTPTPDILYIECSDDVKKLEWNVLSQDKNVGTNFILFEGIAGSTPASTSLQIHNSDGIAPTWVANDYVGKYLIISKKEATTDTQTFENGSSGYVGYASEASVGSSSSGDYTDVTITDGTDSFQADNSDASSFWLKISLATVNYTINKDFPLKRLRIRMSYILELAAKGILELNTRRAVYVKTYVGATDVIASATLLHTAEPARDLLTQRDVTGQYDLWFDISAIQESLFTKGASYWEAGYIWVEVTAVDDWLPLIGTDTLYWYGLEIELEYDETVYLESNDIITANNTSGVVTCNDSEGDPVNFNTRGVTADDSLMITSTLASAFALVGNGVVTTKSTQAKSYPTFTEGYGKRFNGLNSYQFWCELCKHKDLLWFLNYRSSNTLTAKARDALTSESTALTSFKMASVVLENQAYGSIVIFWKDGYVVKETNNGLPLPYVEIRKDYLTEAEANAYAALLATRYATAAYAIELKYNTFIDVQVGYQCDSIAINGTTYTDQLIRRVTYTQDSANGPFETTIYLGRGFTPDDESIGKTIGGIIRKQNMDDAISSSETYTPSSAVKHSDLQQILPTSASQYHLTQTKHTELAGGNIKAVSIEKYSALSDPPKCYDGLDLRNAALTKQKIIYMADGTTTYDAVNFGQLDAVKTTADAALAPDGSNIAEFLEVDSGTDYKNTHADQWGTSGAPSGWTDNDGASCASTIVASYLGHSYPLELDDQNAAAICEVYKTFTAGNIVSFWAAIDIASDYLYIQAYEGATQIGYIYYAIDQIYWFTGSGQLIGTNTDATWHHFYLDFDVAADTVDIYIDGIFNSNKALANAITTNIDKIRIITRSANTGYKGYVDAVYVGSSAAEAWSSWKAGMVVANGVYTPSAIIDALITSGLALNGNVTTNVNKGYDIGTATMAFDDIYADDFQNVASETKSRYIEPTQALEAIRNIKKCLDSDQPDYKTMAFAEEFTKEIRIPNIDKTETVIQEVHHKRSLVKNLDYLNSATQALEQRVQTLEFTLTEIVEKLNQLIEVINK